MRLFHSRCKFPECYEPLARGLVEIKAARMLASSFAAQVEGKAEVARLEAYAYRNELQPPPPRCVHLVFRREERPAGNGPNGEDEVGLVTRHLCSTA